MRTPTVLVAALFLLLAATLRGEEADAIKVRFNKAKASFEREIEKARQAVLDDFNLREEADRKKPDLKAVNEIKAQREAFELSDDIQKYFTSAINRKLAPERKAFASAYEDAIKDYLRLRKDDEANALDKEYKLIKVDLAPVEEQQKDKQKSVSIIWAGMDFEGTGELFTPNANGARTRIVPVPQTLRIRTIEGDKFTGFWGQGKGRAEAAINGSIIDKRTIEFSVPVGGIVRCTIMEDGTATGSWEGASSGRAGAYSLRRTSIAPANANAVAEVAKNDPAYATAPESKNPAETVPIETLVGQLYTSKGGRFVDNNEIYIYVDGTEGSNIKRQFDASKGRRIVQLFPGNNSNTQFALKDGADKRVRAKVTGRFDGPNRMWITSVYEVDRKPEIGLPRP